MADKPCDTCQHYDPILRGSKPGRHGRCAIKSTYPAQPQQGQVFPPGVKRAPDGEPAKPVIVIGRDVVAHCTDYLARPAPIGAVTAAKAGKGARR